MNASCVTSSTSAGSRMKRESSRASLRWYFSTSRLNACLSPPCARVTSCRSISRSDIGPPPQPGARVARQGLPTPGLTCPGLTGPLTTSMCHRHTHLEIVRGEAAAYLGRELLGRYGVCPRARRHRARARKLAPECPDAKRTERAGVQHVAGDENGPPHRPADRKRDHEAGDVAPRGHLDRKPCAPCKVQNDLLACDLQGAGRNLGAKQRAAPGGGSAKRQEAAGENRARARGDNQEDRKRRRRMQRQDQSRQGWRRRELEAQAAQRREKTSVPFVPPKPNEFDPATRIASLRWMLRT